MPPASHFRNSLLQEVAQCLMRLVATKTTADGIDALTGFLQGLTLTWYTADIYAEGRLRRKVVSHRCPRGFTPFVTRMGFLNRQDGTYQGKFEESTLLIVKAGSVSAGDRMFVCAAGFAKDSPLNDGTTTACVGALIHEALTRVLALESDVRRTAALDACLASDDDFVAVFDAQGRLLDRHPGGSQIALPPSLFQTAVSSAARRRLKPTQPNALQFEGRTYNVRSRWIASPLLDCRYLLVHVRARPAAPLVVERLKHYGLSRRESQIAELVFVGQTNQVIAQALFISRDTVKTHCKHIFVKLGISRRTEFLRVMGESSPQPPSDAGRSSA